MVKADFTKLNRAFNPKCVVVVGDKKESGFRWLRADSPVKGKLYSVQINPESVKGIQAMGIENYTSLLDIPEPIDLVVVAVPRAVAPKILEDCIQKDVAVAHFFTSGFSESDTEEGRKQERWMIETANRANFHLIGPNCLGVFSPKAGVRQSPEQYYDSSGVVGFISQSGNIAVRCSMEAHLQGLDFNKSVSFGNGIVLEAADYLEYYAQDPEVKVIGMYLEGVKDGRRFLRVLREVAAQKPVVIWKGGLTDVGGRAIASHTGSMAVSRTIWEAAVKQCGAVNVTTQEELIDTLKALVYLPPVRSDRVGIAGGSGGQSVTVADVFVETGLKIPLLTQKSYDEYASFFKMIGGSYRNPIDAGEINRSELKRVIDILEQDANIDNLALLLTLRGRTPEQIEAQLSLMIDLKQRTPKPMIVILLWSFTTAEVEKAGGIIQRLQGAGIPVFLAFERGARALRNALDYYRLRNGAS
ncbi:MAG: CoA-binding protein [Chloroflexota bacterium]